MVVIKVVSVPFSHANIIQYLEKISEELRHDS
jgi:hypothetical protein